MDGKLILHYIGKHGRHTELYINDELIVAGFNCNKSIMLLLWCACDSQYLDINNYIDVDFTYRETKLGAWLCRTIFKPQLFSNYDVLMKSNAAAYAYRDMIYKKKYDNPISTVLSARRDLFLCIQQKYKLDNLEIIYELNEHEIWASGRI